MKVTCERCGTEYNFDDAKVTEEGVKVKCTRCEHVFRVRKRAFVVTEPVSGSAAATATPAPSIPAWPDPDPPAPAPPSPAPATAQEPSSPGLPREGSSRKWMIRKFDGSSLEFNEMTTLQRWIVERKVGPEDEISHNGVKWKRLGTIPELGPFFDVVSGAAAAPRTDGNGDANGSATLARVADSDRTEPRQVAVRTRGDAAERAAHADAGGDDAAKPRARGAMTAILLVALLGGAGAWAQLTDSGLALTAPARAWLAANTGIDLRTGVPAATPTTLASPTPVATASVVAAAPSPEASAAASVTPAGSAVPSETTAAASPVSSELAVASPASSPEPAASPAKTAAATPAPTKVAAHPHPPSVEQLLTQGYELYSRGKYREAILKYQAAVDADQSNSEAWALLGLAYLDDGQDELAESCLQTSIRINSHFADSHRYLGLLYSKRGDKPHAIAEFNQYLDLRPTGPTSDDVRRRVASLKGG